MIALRRDPHGSTLFRGRIIVSSSGGVLARGDQSKENHIQEIETLRGRVRELESLLNQPQPWNGQTESPREREFQVESVNPSYMQQEVDRRIRFTEDVCLTEEEPTNDEVVPTVMSPSEEASKWRFVQTA